MKGILATKSYLYPVLILLLFNSSCGPSRRTVAIEEGWEIIAERKVNFIKDKDEVIIESRNQFTAIKFKVEDRDIRLNGLKVVFDNGDKLEPSLDVIIPANKESRIIELAQDGRRIDKIEFQYRTTGSLLQGRANVLMFGKRYSPYGTN
jgi:hypothetical protein